MSGGTTKKRRRLAPELPRTVMPGLVPGIHVFVVVLLWHVDGRVKPGHDD